MSNNDNLCQMFTYIGWDKWRSPETDWNNEELATLYYCLWTTLDETEDTQLRHNIVFLMEKFFQESDEFNLDKALKK